MAAPEHTSTRSESLMDLIPTLLPPSLFLSFDDNNPIPVRMSYKDVEEFGGYLLGFISSCILEQAMGTFDCSLIEADSQVSRFSKRILHQLLLRDKATKCLHICISQWLRKSLSVETDLLLKLQKDLSQLPVLYPVPLVTGFISVWAHASGNWLEAKQDLRLSEKEK